MKLQTACLATLLLLASAFAATAGEIADAADSGIDHPAALTGAATAGAGSSQSPGSVGAMSAAVGTTATSADDVFRQSRGQLTAAVTYWRSSADRPGS